MEKNTVSERLKLLRKTLKLHQGDFARQIGLKQAALSMVESGRNPLNDRHIKLICATFNVSERWLRDGEGEMFNAPSPYAKELEEILDRLKPETQEYLLIIARELLTVQRKLVRKCGPGVLDLSDVELPEDETFPPIPETPAPAPAEPNPSSPENVHEPEG